MPTYSIKKLPNVFDAQVARLHSIKCLLTEMCAKYGGHRSNDSTFLRTIAPFEFRTNRIVSCTAGDYLVVGNGRHFVGRIGMCRQKSFPG